MTQPDREPKSAESDLCSDCPPVGYPTDETRCNPCPRRSPETEHVEPEGEVDALVAEARSKWLDPRISRNLFVLISELCEDARNTAPDAIFDVTQHVEKLCAFIDGRVASASALSSRRALSREEVARIIDPVAFDEKPDPLLNEEANETVFYSHGKRRVEALSKADAILSRVEGK